MKKIIVLEACDGFSIQIYNEEDILMKHYWFSQEDDKTNLVEMFEYLGFESEYEEDY